jgi:P27 family predicted phage terminase small subunit
MTRANWFANPRLTGKALERWKKLAPAAHQAAKLTPENVEQFMILVRLLVLIEQTADEIERDGVAVKAASGGLRTHPGVAVLMDAQKAVAPLLEEFGLVRRKGPFE